MVQKDGDEDSEENSSNAVLIVIVVVLIFLILVAAIIFWVYHERFNGCCKRKSGNSISSMFDSSALPQSTNRPVVTPHEDENKDILSFEYNQAAINANKNVELAGSIHTLK